ncbi:hypothetical protein [Actinokineospora sp. UTMC 2448]|uniref:hypothetical protein n=1 Tax=Actinokineospora sp. UTMC 2448 TaxID=2268449 RepID=UPI002164ECEF|nr:hypothetical protein [Actinokineospora sp. UTMC 2448]UVS79687.1 Signal transduction histidine kinase [Actinokineospora sp. UTMC 2448]
MPKGRRPHDVVAGVPSGSLVDALVRNLADGLGADVAYCVPMAGDLSVVTSWPEHPPARIDRPDAVRMPVADDGMLVVAGVDRWGSGELALLRETAAWIGVSAGLDRARADRVRAESRAHRLRAEVARARGRLAKVRDLERQRLVQSITATTLRDLDDVRGRLLAVRETADHHAVARELDGVRSALDDLLDRFRTVVRGVYPAMLPDRGPTAALAELAATLPRPVRFGGDLGRRVGWEVESGLYQAVAAVLTVLAGVSSDRPVAVDFQRDNALLVRVTADTAGMTAKELRSALAYDAERLAVLGGMLECAVEDGVGVVTVRVAERIEPAAGPRPDVERSAVYRDVRDLVRRGARDAAGGRAQAAWDAVAERMAAPPRIAVVGAHAAGAVPDRVEGVDVVAVTGPADRGLAERLAGDDPRAGVDAVLCLDPPEAEFPSALRASRHRILLARSGGIAELARALTARAPLIAARRALVSVAGLVAALPPHHPLRFAADRITTEAHDLAELDLLDDIDSTAVLRGSAADAARLLGAHGPDPRTRLGLPAAATDEDVTTAAHHAAARWRTHAEHPATPGRDRRACEILVRTAEGIITRTRAH